MEHARRAWLTLLVLALVVWPAQRTGAHEDDPVPLRVLTYNLLHDGPWSGFFDNGTHLQDRLAMTIRELHALNPDVIALQEASRSRVHGDVAQRIADELGFHVVYGGATDRIFGIRLLDRIIAAALGFVEGPAILSRFPIVDSELYELPRCAHRLVPRILLRATVRAPGTPIHVYSAHTSRGDDCQLDRIAEVLEAGRLDGQAILMGDLNAGDESPALVRWRERHGFRDVFRSVNPDAPGFTVWQQILEPRSTTSRRVDFIFLVSETPPGAAVRSSRLVFDRPGRSSNGAPLWPSDHRGVLADLELVRAPVDRAATP